MSIAEWNGHVSQEYESLRDDDLVQTDVLTDDLRRRSVQAGAAVIAGQVVTNVLNLGATVVLARLLTPGDFGLVAMVLVVVGFTTMLRDLGLTAATVQRKDIDIHQVSTLFWINAGMSALLTAVIFFGAPIVVWFYDEPRLLDITLVLAFASLIDGVSIQHQALLRRQLRLGSLTAIEIASLAGSIGTAIFLASRGAGYWALVWMQLTQLGIRTILCWLVTGWRPMLTLNLKEVGSLLSFGSFITGSRVLNNLTKTVDKLLIGKFASAEQLGVYSKAYNGVLLPFDRITWALSRVAVPTLSRLQDDAERFRAYYRKAVLLIATLIFPAIAGLFLEAEAAVLIILGDQWLFAVPLIRILAPIAAVAMLSMTMRWVFVSLGRAGRLLKWRMLESTIKIVGIAAGIPWGATGVAYALLIVSVALLLPGLWYCFVETRIRLTDVFTAAWKPSLATMVAALAVGALRMAGSPGISVIADFVVEASLFISVYLATWLVLPGGRVTLLELLSLTRELRKSPTGSQ